MNVLILTVGTMGDVAPYTGLGRRLADAGHHVAIATHDRYAGLVREAGLEFRSVPTDPATYFDRPDGVSRARWTVRSSFGYARATGRDLLRAAAPGADVILTSATAAPWSPHIAEALGVPSMGVYVEAAYATRDFFPFVGRSIGRPLNLAAGRAIFAVVDALVAPTVKELRADLGLPPLRPGRLRRRQAAEVWPVCCGFSPALLPRPADWPRGMELVGFWWPEPPAHWEPSETLIDFIAGGPAPVFVGFGSVRPDNGEELGTVIRTALRRNKLRGVVLQGPVEVETDDDLITTPETRYDRLFPEVAAVVHAGGAGTTAATLRAGVPSVTVPAVTDQQFWSWRLAEVGASTAPIPLPRLTVDRLSAALRTVLDRPEHRVAAGRLQASITAEDGAGATVRRLHALLDRTPLTD
jgi:UDP:flavonoid glycosyltransferase YjiC (YdhE family)